MRWTDVNTAGDLLESGQTMSSRTALGKIIERELKRRNWSQGQLAAKADCSQPVISAIINGVTQNPKTTVLRGIAEAFGWSLNQLLDLAPGESTSTRSTRAVEEGLFFATLDRVNRRLATLETTPEELATPLARASETEGLWRAVGKLQAAVDELTPALQELRSRVENIELRAAAPHKPRRRAD